MSETTTHLPPRSATFLPAEGGVGALIGSINWSDIPLGAIETWPPSLKTSISNCLHSSDSTVVWWGNDYVNFYNDACLPLLGTKHPESLGACAKDVWPEIWHIIEPTLRGVMDRGEAARSQDLLLELARDGEPEERYFTFSYSPIRDESGRVAGVLTQIQETTGHVLGERRQRTLGELAERLRLSHRQGGEEICRLAAETLAANLRDIPFSAIYLLSTDEKYARLAATSGIESPIALFPETVDLQGQTSWIFAAGVRAGQAEVVTLPANQDLPSSAWPHPPHQALVLQLSEGNRNVGALVVGVSPLRGLDEDYRGFLALAAGHISATLTHSRTLEEGSARGESVPSSPQIPFEPKRGRLLLAENNAGVCRYLTSVLRTEYEVEAVARGEEALARALEHPPDLVVIGGTPLEGRNFVVALRKNPRTSTLPVICLRSPEEDLQTDDLEAGANDYLTKPFTARELLARIRIHLELARVRADAARTELDLRAEVKAAHRHAFDVLESITDGVFTLDSDWRFVYVNAAGEKLLASRREDLLGRNHWELYPATIGTIGEYEYRRAVRDHIAVEFDIFYEPWHRWFAVKAYPTEHGGISVYFRDATKRKQNEADIKKQSGIYEAERRKWRDLFLQVPAAVAILRGPDHEFQSVNEAFLHLVGLSQGDLLGRAVRHVFPEFISQGYVDRLDRVYSTGVAYGAMEALVRFGQAGGIPRDVFLNFLYSPTHDDLGQVDGILVHAVDVTGLVDSRRRIEEANRRFALALTATRGLVYEWNKTTGALTRERGLDDLIGWREDEVPSTAEWWSAQIHPQDLNPISSDDANLPASQSMAVFIYRVRHRDGTWMWVEDHALLHRAESGHVERVVGFVININARKHAEQQLRHSQEHFRTAVTAVSDIVWTNNAHGQMEGEQPGWAGFTGQSFDEYQGYGWSAAVHPDDAQPTIDAWNLAVAERRRFVFEHRVRRHDGEWRVCSIRALPLLDEDGAVREWVGVHTDITGPRQAEEALRQSEERFRQVADSLPQVVWTADANGLCDYVNLRWTELSGCDLAATNAGAFREHMPAEDLAILDAAAARGALRGEPYSFECRFLRVADRALRWHLVRAVPVRDKAGTITKWLGTSTDIDDQRRAAEAMRESEERFRMLANNMDQFAWIADATGSIYWYNQRWYDYTGTNLEAMRGWGWQSVHHPDHLDRVVSLFKHHLSNGEA